MRKKKGYFYTTNMATVKIIEQWKYLLALKIEKYKHTHGRKEDMNLEKTEVILREYHLNTDLSYVFLLWLILNYTYEMASLPETNFNLFYFLTFV